ncbi:MAG: hypothetical protein WCG03_04670 [Kiritimatiellales bacterium]
MKSYKIRIARLEKILGPRSQKAALLLLVDLLVHEKKGEERQERSGRRRPPKVINPNEGGNPHWLFENEPASHERVLPPPAMAECYTAPAQPDPPAAPACERKTARETSPVVDMRVFPEHWQFNRGLCVESEDEQRRRMPPQVF